MTKKSDFVDVPTYFSGACSKCGEVYQASSKSDDLEGIGFRCKKAPCAGRVTLGVASPEFVRSEKGEKSKPTRAC